jgi:penicillin-binding protein 2
MNSRIKYLTLSLIAVLFSLVLGLWRIQVLRSERYRLLSESNRVRVIPIVAPRGRILDRNGVILAQDSPSYELIVIPQDLSRDGSALKKVSSISNTSIAYFQEKVKQQFVAPFYPIVLLSDIDPSMIAKIEEQSIDLPGIRVRGVFQRDYPKKQPFSHIIGYVARPSIEEIFLGDKFLTDEDWVGRAGIEKTMDDVIRGKNGKMQIEVDNRGRMVRILGRQDPERGTDVRLTIDAGLQQFCSELLQDKKGSIVVLDGLSGGVLAMVSSPSYNPNYFVSSNSNQISQILNDERAVMLNRAVRSYPPGSIFKTITAIAGIHKNIINEHKSFQCRGSIDIGGHRIRCLGGVSHGVIGLHDALVYSCNTYFVNLGMLLGVENIAAYARLVNLGKPIGIEIPFERPGLIPSRRWKQQTRNERWFKGDTANMSIGQGFVLVSPLQMANIAMIVANNGIFYKPHLIHGKTQNRPVRVLEPEVFFPVRDAMEDVVRRGTGRLAKYQIPIAGKTGSAEVGDNRSHAWFIGYSPAENPKIAFSIFLEYGGRGGEEPARIAQRIVQYWSKRNRVAFNLGN